MDRSHDIRQLVLGIAELKIETQKGAHITIEATRTFNQLAVKRAVTQLLKGFGVDVRDPNFVGTPDRVVRMWREWLAPRRLDMRVFESSSKGAVTLVNHTTVSVCPHHLLPFELTVDVAYIPQGYVVGLSKLARMADFVASSFALQEHIPEFIVRVLSALLIPKGVICRSRARHGCMRLRGVRTVAEVATTSVDGVYLTDEKARNEFLGETWHAQRTRT